MKIKKQNPKAVEFFKKYGKKYACIGALGGMLFMPVSAKAMADTSNLGKFKPDKNNALPKKENTNKADKELVDQIEKAINSKEEYISVKANDGKNIETTNQNETDKGYISVTVDGIEKKFEGDNPTESITEAAEYVGEKLKETSDINIEDLVFTYSTPHKQVSDSKEESYIRKVIRFKANSNILESGIDPTDYYALFKYVNENGFNEYFTIIEEKEEKVQINQNEYILEIEGKGIKISIPASDIEDMQESSEDKASEAFAELVFVFVIAMAGVFLVAKAAESK